MSKKLIKSFLKENGLFTQFSIEKTTQKKENFIKKIPENALYFESIASNTELNRNGYKIDMEAFRASLTEFIKSGVLLLSHDQEKPIGKPLFVEIRETKTGKELFIGGYIFDELTDYRFSKGLFDSLSTGHLVAEFMFEDLKTGKRYSEENFFKMLSEKGDEMDLSSFARVITKTELFEVSIVAIGANREARISAREDIDFCIKTENERIKGLSGFEKNELNDFLISKNMKKFKITASESEQFSEKLKELGLKEGDVVEESVFKKIYESEEDVLEKNKKVEKVEKNEGKEQVKPNILISEMVGDLQNLTKQVESFVDKKQRARFEKDQKFKEEIFAKFKEVERTQLIEMIGVLVESVRDLKVKLEEKPERKVLANFPSSALLDSENEKTKKNEAYFLDALAKKTI